MYEHLLRRIVKLRAGLVFKARRRLNHSTLGLRVIKKREEEAVFVALGRQFPPGLAGSQTALSVRGLKC